MNFPRDQLAPLGAEQWAAPQLRPILNCIVPAE